MGVPRFGRPKGGNSEISTNLFVANCGPGVGVSYDDIKQYFSNFGEVKGVYAADESGTRVVVCFDDKNCAKSALEALHGNLCHELGGRRLHISYSVLQPSSQEIGLYRDASYGNLTVEDIKECFFRPARNNDTLPVSLDASELNIPGLYLFHDFVSSEEEEALLAAVDNMSWNSLSKRRVQHYGYEFCYDTRNVNTKKHLGELPSFTHNVLERISSFPGYEKATDLNVDQLTVNEYPSGVGLSPHIDTHSAFEGFIFSLSLAGPCIMEFRKFSEGTFLQKPITHANKKVDCTDNSNFIRKAIFLPRRSMLLLSGEARYAWHHYIPHHKLDIVNDRVIKRSSRRVSFTFRKVRTGLCQCEYPQYCDSQAWEDNSVW